MFEKAQLEAFRKLLYRLLNPGLQCDRHREPLSYECLTVPMLLHATIECSAGLDLYAIDLHNQTVARAWFDASVSM